MNEVDASINAAITFLESFWSWFDTFTIVGDITFLDLAFGSYVASVSLWFVFNFNGGDDE